MTLAARHALTIPQNGVGAFILQCKRIDFHYCDWAGSSKGMKYAESHASSLYYPLTIFFQQLP